MNKLLGWISEHQRLVAVTLLAGAVALVGGFLWFRPDKLFVDATVNETFGEATTLAEGTFEGLAHPTTGTARIVTTDEGAELRLVDFRTDNGPDLVVWLSTAQPGGDYAQEFVDLGGLKGNVGDQSYAIDPSIDVERYRSVVIWCRRFTVGFGVAGVASPA